METVKKFILILAAPIFISSCASIVPPGGLSATNCNPNLNLACVEDPQVVEMPTQRTIKKFT